MTLFAPPSFTNYFSLSAVGDTQDVRGTERSGGVGALGDLVA